MEHKINLFLVRHGETYLNRYKKMQGWADSPLTEEGKVTAIESGKRLATVPFNRVYSSDLGRTVETAKLILQQNYHNHDLEINKRKAFREAFFGGFEGEYLEEALRKIAQDNGYHYNRGVEIFQNHSNEEVLNFIKNSDPFHHAENYREIWERIEIGLNEIVSKSESNNENILLVTHGVIIRNVIDKFSDGVNFEGKINNSSVSVLEYSGSNFKVVSFNQ
ncbi:histidine phosphatase family protein [Bacillus sp. V3B]|uniref:histidine phosphatase family protein n=1 Tax=Bacillus sp. V3B TaxID=2804915 RepID=UPI00210DE609|nr:histidine phosphatase family protein [Bacillus sp. V3B]MCQ6277247.1 histidine phosphatase family protein [Bacillus sp. V3B]